MTKPTNTMTKSKFTRKAAPKAAPKATQPAAPTYPELTPAHLPPLDDKHRELIVTLHSALTAKRPHGSAEEAQLITWMALRHACTLIDGAGNVHFDRRTSTQHKTLFTAHTDTVHHTGGANAVSVDGKFLRARGDKLGADDGAGVALLAHMMHNNVPGYYVLFRGEECGGVGSSWLADNMEGLLSEFDRAVAFDRAGYYDVITHQGGRRCCSDEFADALAQQLSAEDSGVMYIPCSGGVYTDTAEFVSVIPECTNLSVGYKRQHSAEEEQDVEFLKQLADIACLVQWDTLPTKRNPMEVKPAWQSRFDDSAYMSKSYWNGNTSHRDTWEDFKAWASVPDTNAPSYDPMDDMDADELDLYYALLEAKEDLRTTWLIEEVSQLISPDQPEACRINPSRITAKLIDDAIEFLMEGHDAYVVADEIYKHAQS